MSGSPRCRKSPVVHASCDNCGVRPETIHKLAARGDARYCVDCCPACRANHQVESGRGIFVTSSLATAEFAAGAIPSPNALVSALQSQGFAVISRVLYGAAGPEQGLDIDGYFHPAWELNGEENRGDVAVFDFAAIRRRRGPDWTSSRPATVKSWRTNWPEGHVIRNPSV